MVLVVDVVVAGLEAAVVVVAGLDVVVVVVAVAGLEAEWTCGATDGVCAIAMGASAKTISDFRNIFMSPILTRRAARRQAPLLRQVQHLLLLPLA
jgi:hypothetical protein